MVLMAPLVLGAVPFWAPYQNIWLAMGEGITAGEAFTPTQRLRLAHVYAAVVVVTLLIATVYWKVVAI